MRDFRLPPPPSLLERASASWYIPTQPISRTQTYLPNLPLRTRAPRKERNKWGDPLYTIDIYIGLSSLSLPLLYLSILGLLVIELLHLASLLMIFSHPTSFRMMATVSE